MFVGVELQLLLKAGKMRTTLLRQFPKQSKQMKTNSLVCVFSASGLASAFFPARVDCQAFAAAVQFSARHFPECIHLLCCRQLLYVCRLPALMPLFSILHPFGFSFHLFFMLKHIISVNAFHCYNRFSRTLLIRRFLHGGCPQARRQMRLWVFL